MHHWHSLGNSTYPEGDFIDMGMGWRGNRQGKEGKEREGKERKGEFVLRKGKHE